MLAYVDLEGTYGIAHDRQEGKKSSESGDNLRDLHDLCSLPI